MRAAVSRILIRTIVSLAAAALAGAVAGLLASAAWGWAVFAGCVCVILLYHLWHLSMLARWRRLLGL